MKQAERDELLIRLDERTQVTEATVKRLDRTINGNGKPGMKEEFDEVKNNQVHCMNERAQRKVDLRWIAIFLLAVFEVIMMVKDI